MSNILKGLNEGYFNRDEQDQQNAMDTRRSSDLSRERNAGLNEPDELPTTPQQSRNGVYEYNVPTGQEKIAQELGLQLHKGHWFSRIPVQKADFQFGRPQFHEIASKNVSEAEQDYGPEYQDKVKRLGQMAKQGERKTVWDPVKRVYKTVPVNPPKKEGVAEGYSSTTFNVDRRKLNVPALIQKGAILVTHPHGEQGWETDDKEDWAFSLLSLYNVLQGGWPSEAKKYLKPQSYKRAEQQINSSAPNLGSDKLVYDGKYNQILWSIKKLGIPDNVAFLDKGQQGVAEEQLDELSCWSGYHRVAGTKAGFPGSCAKNKTNEEGVAEEQHSCPHCGGEMVSEELMNEKKDACYYKVKSRYKVWPSAYASGALVKCRKSGADSWGNGGKKNESSILEGIEQVDENLHKWFKEKWVRFGPDGKIRGDCARGDDSEGKPKCLPQSKAQNLGKKGRASAAARKRREDPNPERSGKAINVNTKKKSNEGIAEGWVDTIKNIFKRKPRDNRTVFEKDPEAMREFERSGGYEAGLDITGWQIGWFAASHAQGDTMNQAFSKLYYGGGSPVPFDNRSFKLAWVAYNKHHGPQIAEQGVAEEQLDEKWSQKYKDSINCSNPKGFSQKAHCQGKNK